MIQINVGDHAGSENNDAFSPIPTQFHQSVRWARRRARQIAHDLPGADRYFVTLGRARSLTSLLDSRHIWINYGGDVHGLYGWTYQNNDLWLCDGALRRGRWTVLATLIHELAHIAGAGGGRACDVWSSRCHAAERAVLECNLGYHGELSTGIDDPRTPYDPTISG